jgi:hypothetical protein
MRIRGNKAFLPAGMPGQSGKTKVKIIEWLWTKGEPQHIGQYKYHKFNLSILFSLAGIEFSERSDSYFNKMFCSLGWQIQATENKGGNLSGQERLCPEYAYQEAVFNKRACERNPRHRMVLADSNLGRPAPVYSGRQKDARRP